MNNLTYHLAVKNLSDMMSQRNMLGDYYFKRYYNGFLPQQILQHGGYYGGSEAHELIQPELEKTKPFRFEVFSEPLPEHAPPALRTLLSQWGNATLIDSRVCRVPLPNYLKKLGNWLSLGKLERERKKLGYNDFFHLFWMARVRKDNGQEKTFLIEKNELGGWKILHSQPAKAECVQEPVKPITLNEIFYNAEQKYGGNRMYVYSVNQNNCQQFVIDLLSASDILDHSTIPFIKQNAEQLMPKYLSGTANKVTNFASRLKRFFTGSARRPAKQKAKRQPRKYNTTKRQPNKRR